MTGHEQGRLGDRAKVPADSHGCPSCAHTCMGPAESGSPNVAVNGLPALRLGDTGIHFACCGSNTWTAADGSDSVLINNRRAHRVGDPTQHCGGNGKLIDGSTNVFVGSRDSGITDQLASYRADVRVVFPNGRVARGILVYARSGNVEHFAITDRNGLVTLLFGEDKNVAIRIGGYAGNYQGTES